MKALRCIDTIRRFGDDVRYRLASMAILMTGAFLIIGAAGLGVAGGFLWLSTQMPSYLAALAVAGGLFLVGAIIVASAWGRNSRHKATPSAPAPAPMHIDEADAEMIADRMIHSALGSVAESPLKAILGAIALGIVVGVLRTKKSP